MPRVSIRIAAALASAGVLALTAGGARAAQNGFIYLGFDSFIAATDIGSANGELGFSSASHLTNVTAGGGFAYWQDGSSVYKGNADLSVVGLLNSYGSTPVDLAVDAADGYLYLAFDTFIAATDTGTGTGELAFVTGSNISHVASGGGSVYWQQGNSVYKANADLTGAGLLTTYFETPLGLAVDAADGFLYVAFPDFIAATDIATGSNELAFVSTPGVSGITAEGGQVYWQQGASLYRSNADLSGGGLMNTFGATPVDLAAYAIGGGAPEPGAWALMLAGFGLAGAGLRRRRAAA